MKQSFIAYHLGHIRYIRVGIVSNLLWIMVRKNRISFLYLDTALDRLFDIDLFISSFFRGVRLGSVRDIKCKIIKQS